MDRESLDAVYQQQILQRSRQPQAERKLEQADFEQQADNPLCGDRILVAGRLSTPAEGEPERIAEIAFEAEACAIVRASADVMASELQGLPLAEARVKIAQFLEQLTEPDRLKQHMQGGQKEGGGVEIEAEAQGENELEAILSVRKLPARIKCASLPWEALEKALDSSLSEHL